VAAEARFPPCKKDSPPPGTAVVMTVPVYSMR